VKTSAKYFGLALGP